MKQGKVTLFVSTFGERVSWIYKKYKEGIEINPVEVGAETRTNYNYELKDNVGEDNISVENPYWGELSGLYWIWKNVLLEDDDIIGFAHYNKILKVTPEEITNAFEKEGISFLVKPAFAAIPHDYPEDIEALEKVLMDGYPGEFQCWKILYDSSGASRNKIPNCYNCELFYTKYGDFKKYCQFLFDVLFKVKKEIGNVERAPYHKRYLAFLGERLLSVYLMKNNYHFKSVAMTGLEPGYIKVLREISDILGFDHNSKFYMLVRILFGRNKRKSSYTQLEGHLDR